MLNEDDHTIIEAGAKAGEYQRIEVVPRITLRFPWENGIAKQMERDGRTAEIVTERLKQGLAAWGQGVGEVGRKS